MILATAEQVAEMIGTTGFNNGLWHRVEWFRQTGGVSEPIRYYPCSRKGEIITGPHLEMTRDGVLVRLDKAGFPAGLDRPRAFL